VEFGAGL